MGLGGLIGGALGGMLGGNKKGGSNIINVVDPYKTKISEAMTPFLESRIGKGLPSYEGQLYENLNPNTINNMNSFLSLSPTDWFNKNVQDPTVKNYKENVLPDIQESFAGGLRGSGRYTNELDSMNNLYTNLASQRAQAEIDIPAKQFDMASSYKKLKDLDYLLEYNNWYTSLPETNPILKTALDFLNSDTGLAMGTDSTEGSGGMTDWLQMATGMLGKDGILSGILGKKGGATTGGYTPTQNSNTMYNDIYDMSGSLNY